MLDADRKPLGQPTNIPTRNNANEPWKRNSIRLTSAGTGAGVAGEAPAVVIPPGAAFLVLGLATNDEFKVAGLRLEKMGNPPDDRK